MDQPTSYSEDFLVKNCALASIATGLRANSLLELRDKLMIVDEGCIYYHFWGGRMHYYFAHPQYHNDFSSWVYHRLHDNALAEKLNIIDPTGFNSLEELRQELLETIEQRLDEYETVFWTKKEDHFHFIRSSTVIFESSLKIFHPQELVEVIPNLPPSSIFYHFIDARSRTEEKNDDFTVWLKMYGEEYADLIQEIKLVDPYFLSLTQLRYELSHIMKSYFSSRRQVS